MSDRGGDDMTDLTAAPRKAGAPPRFESPIVPRNSISGRALVAVVGILTFLASLPGGAVGLAKGIAGIADVRAMSKDESARLLEPFLGAGLKLDELPVPRMVVATLASGASPDFAQLRSALAADVPSASLDDHRGWAGRMRAMANSVVAIGFAILGLMLAATILSVSFATRGAMATN